MLNIPNIPRLFVKSETLNGFQCTHKGALMTVFSTAYYHEFYFSKCFILVRVTVDPGNTGNMAGNHAHGRVQGI